jgi:hypothetical protein
MDPITVARLWMVVKPIKRIKEARQRRRAERMAEKVILTTATGETIEHSPPLINARTSTKAAAGTVLLGYPVVDIVAAIQGANIPIEWLESFTNGPVFEWLCYSIIPVLIARFTKSPLSKQAL